MEWYQVIYSGFTYLVANIIASLSIEGLEMVCKHWNFF
jgi:hypothetical protein